MAVIYQDALEERANNLGTLNGFKLVLVQLVSGPPAVAKLEAEFYNTNQLAGVVTDINFNGVPPGAIFKIHGGQRVPAGDAVDQVRVTAVAAGAAADTLVLTVEPIGDYSTYTLEILHPAIDPLLSEIPFKFRPGCFTNNCAPEWAPGQPPGAGPAIDYLAKDYDSFRHTLIAAMMERVPGWQVTSEADLDQVLIDLFSATADELSDFQDRVMNEAYLVTSRKRVSLARHARLMDYHIHQGNQSSSWLALKVNTAGLFTLPAKFTAWTGQAQKDRESIAFATRKTWPLHPLANRMRLYNWTGAVPALAAGDTRADLLLDTPGQAAAETVRDLIRDGTLPRLIVQEWKNPATGREAGRNPQKRQLLELLKGNAGAAALRDPVANIWFVRVSWREEDRLKHEYCFTSFCPGGDVDDVSLFHGNLALVHQGEPAEIDFVEPGTLPLGANQFYYERPDPLEEDRRGVVCRLPSRFLPLAYLPTLPGGEIEPQSTLEIDVILSGGGSDRWDEVVSLVHSDASEESGDHFAVETDEQQRSILRFGNGVNGRRLPKDARVHCEYQIGGGVIGNVGPDTLRFFDAIGVPEVAECRNPFDGIDGRDLEPVEKILRAVPEAYRARQLRAVTLRDYIKRAEELPEVSRAVAAYAWTGSWRTVRIAIDPAGATELKDELRRQIARHLDAVRLIGEDLEIRPPLFVPLAIEVALCVDAEFWREDLRFVLEQEFAEGYTPDGRPGFFHPDLWTFGQPLRASEIAGRIHRIPGVEHVISIKLKRWNQPASATTDIVEVRFNEIIRVRNDPDSMEDGSIRFDLQGGRQ